MAQHAAERGFTLADRLAHPAPMTPLEVALVGHQLALALDAWHRGGTSHRALDPAVVAVEVDPDGRLLARLHPPAADARAADRYRAPEQVTGRPVGPAADVFALGVVLLDGLTGRQDGAPAVPTDLGAAWRYLLASMIAASPADRPTAGTVAHTLARVPGVAASAGPVGPTGPTGPTGPSGPTPSAPVAPRSKLLPGGAHVQPVPIDLPKQSRLTRLLPSVPGLRRPAREPDVRHQPDETP